MEIPKVEVTNRLILTDAGSTTDRYDMQIWTEPGRWSRATGVTWAKANLWLRVHGVPRNTARGMLTDAVREREHAVRSAELGLKILKEG